MLSVNIIAYPEGYVNTLIKICIERLKSKAVRLSLSMLHHEKATQTGGFFVSVVDHQACENLVSAGETKEKGSHFPLEDRQARLSGGECGNIDAKRQNP